MAEDWRSKHEDVFKLAYIMHFYGRITSAAEDMLHVRPLPQMMGPGRSSESRMLEFLRRVVTVCGNGPGVRILLPSFE